MIKDKININIVNVILVLCLFFICNFTTLKLKPSFLFKQKRGGDVGFPSVCCNYVLLPLANKEAAFDQWLNRVKPDEKSEQRCKRE